MGSLERQKRHGRHPWLIFDAARIAFSKRLARTKSCRHSSQSFSRSDPEAPCRVEQRIPPDLATQWKRGEFVPIDRDIACNYFPVPSFWPSQRISARWSRCFSCRTASCCGLRLTRPICGSVTDTGDDIAVLRTHGEYAGYVVTSAGKRARGTFIVYHGNCESAQTKAAIR